MPSWKKSALGRRHPCTETLDQDWRLLGVTTRWMAGPTSWKTLKAWPKQGKIKKKRNPATTRPLQPWSEALFSVWPESGSPGTLRTARCWALLVVGVVGGVVLVRGGCWSCGEWRQNCLRWWTEAPLTRTRVHRCWAGLLRLLLGTRTRLLRGGWAIFLRWLCGWGWLTAIKLRCILSFNLVITS